MHEIERCVSLSSSFSFFSRQLIEKPNESNRIKSPANERRIGQCWSFEGNTGVEGDKDPSAARNILYEAEEYFLKL